MNRLLFLEDTGPSGVISSQTYTLGPTGRRDAVVEQDGRRVDYTYDALDRLTQESITDAVFGDQTFDYTYDTVGNRLSRNDSANGLTEYTYDANDRLLTETLAGALTVYTYDNNGNTLSRASATDQAFYSWDFENRLITADTDGDGTIDVRNIYDANGIRVSQTVGGQETRFLIDTVQPLAQVLLEYQPSGLITASYVYGRSLVSQIRDGVKSFYHADGLGSTRALTNVAGLVTDRYIYDAFGTTLNASGQTVNPYLFAGQQRDLSLNLDYLRARFLDVGTGRFLSADTFSGLLHNPLTLNKFAYTAQNPVNFTDPSGHFFGVPAILSLLNTLSRVTTLVGRFETYINSAEALADFLTITFFGLNVYRAVVDGDFTAGVAHVLYQAGEGHESEAIQKMELRTSRNGKMNDLILTFAMDFGSLRGTKPQPGGFTPGKFRIQLDLSHPSKSDIQAGTNLHIHTIEKLGLEWLKLELAIRLGRALKVGIEGTVGPGGLFKVSVPLWSANLLPGKSPVSVF